MTREEVIRGLEEAIQHYSRYSGDEYGREYDYARVGVDVLEDALTLLKGEGEGAVWKYYLNDEGRARWRCSYCGKVCHRNPHDKRYCSICGKVMRLEG